MSKRPHERDLTQAKYASGAAGDYLLSTRQNNLDALHEEESTEEESTEFNRRYPQGAIFLCDQQT